MHRRSRSRLNRVRRSGHATMELAASLLFIVPLVMVLLFAVLELVKAYAINSVLSEAARISSRQLAVLYPDNPTIKQRSSQNALVFNQLCYGGVIANSAQFDDAVFNTAADPPTVTVTVRYLGGQYGLDPFPSYDPLGIGRNFKLSSTSIYRLESN
ncbi:MAG: pilus assembly protein [Candidatus Obscuribacterales bacterium]|nr:pilus assembly protein [Candidatus Obscuribacterales bacterium]